MGNQRAAKIPLSADELMVEARRVTAINIVDQDIIEPLHMLVGSYNNDAVLHESGACAKQKMLLRILSNRLRMQRDIKANPEILNEVIQPPIIVYGLARSGTTKVQKMLAAAGDVNYLPFWQTFNPSLISGNRDESPAQRVQEADEFTGWLSEVAPESLLGHSAETHEPEEDTFLSDHSFYTPGYMRFANLPGYLQWLASQDLSKCLEHLKDTLKYLQWQGLATGEKPWVLKSPTYYGLEPLLLKVFPDAKLVMTHRSPYKTMGSGCKLLQTMHKAFTDHPVDYLGLPAALGALTKVHMMHRNNPDITILDIDSISAGASACELAQQIYDFAGVGLSAQAKQKIITWVQSNPKHKRGGFTYSLAEFGLSKADVDEHFGRYIAFLRKDLKMSF